jgi:flagellar biosynthesis component FlhA
MFALDLAGIFRQFDLLPEFLRCLKKHFTAAAMGATVSGIIIFVVALLTSLPHGIWLIVLLAAFFFSAYAAWREEYLKSMHNELSPEAQALAEHAKAARELARELRIKSVERRFDQAWGWLNPGTKGKPPKDEDE